MVRSILSDARHTVLVCCAVPTPNAAASKPAAIATTTAAPELNAAATKTPPAVQRVVLGERATATAGDSKTPVASTAIGVDVLACPVSKWFALDRNSAWAEWGSGSVSHGASIAAFAPDVVIGIDWTANGVYRALRAANVIRPDTPYVYSSLRVFAVNPSNTSDDAAFYTAAEREACELAVASRGSIIVLSSGDKLEIERIIANAKPTATAAAATNVESKRIAILNPPLRRDVLLLATANEQTAASPTSTTATATAAASASTSVSIVVPKPVSTAVATAGDRIYLSCCCRLSPEKNVGLFIDLCIALRDDLKAAGIVPFVCGVGGADLKLKLQTAFPGPNECRICEFMSAPELCAIFQRSVLNVHPPTYEAYGMTIIESAAFGVPSVIHRSGIGAADRLKDGFDVIRCDLTDSSELVRTVNRLLTTDRAQLTAIGANARRTALAYTELEHSRALIELIDSTAATAAAASGTGAVAAVASAAASAPVPALAVAVAAAV